MQNLGGQWENTNYSKLRFYGVFISNHVNLITFLPHWALCYTETIIYLETKGPVLMVGWLVGKWTWEASTKRSLQKKMVRSEISYIFHYKWPMRCLWSLRCLPYEWVCISQFCSVGVFTELCAFCCGKLFKKNRVDSLYLIYVTPGRKQLFIYLRGSLRFGKWQGRGRRTISSGEWNCRCG